MPGRVYSHDVSVVEFRSDQRITFAIDFVAGKGFHPRTRRAPVQNQLMVLNLDVYFPGPDLRPGHVCVGETFIQIRMAGLILQLSSSFEPQWLARWSADRRRPIHSISNRNFAVEFAHRSAPAVRSLAQLRRGSHLKRPTSPSRQSFSLGLEFFLEDADRLLAHADLRAIEQHVVKRDAHIHRHSIHERLVLERSLFLD